MPLHQICTKWLLCYFLMQEFKKEEKKNRDALVFWLWLGVKLIGILQSLVPELLNSGSQTLYPLTMGADNCSKAVKWCKLCERNSYIFICGCKYYISKFKTNHRHYGKTVKINVSAFQRKTALKVKVTQIHSQLSVTVVKNTSASCLVVTDDFSDGWNDSLAHLMFKHSSLETYLPPNTNFLKPEGQNGFVMVLVYCFESINNPSNSLSYSFIDILLTLHAWFSVHVL